MKTIQGARIPEWSQTALSGLLIGSLKTFYPDVVLLAQLGRQVMSFPINLIFLSAAKLHQENGSFLPFIGLPCKNASHREREDSQ